MFQLPEIQFIDTYKQIGIVHEDNHVVVIHKPRNIPVQADDSKDESVQQLLQEYFKKKYDKPGNVFVGIVHRLDRPVSGLMVFAKTSKGASRLSDQMRSGAFDKKYIALVEGKTKSKGDLKDYLLKDSKTNTVKVVPKTTPEAKEALLSFEQIGFKNQTSCVLIDLQTGRPHQIRVQFSNMGHPLLGDAKYGKDTTGRTHQIELKSIEIGFQHPTTKEPLHFTGIVKDTPNWKLFF